MKTLFIVGVMVTMTTVIGLPALAQSTPAPACNVTVPNRLSPPDFPPNHANASLGVWVPEKGVLTFRPGGPGFVLPDGALVMKFGWLRYEPGERVVRGRRLDGPAAPLRSRISEGTPDGGLPPRALGFHPSYLIFPAPGCWEITGDVSGKTLTAVILVEKIGVGPTALERLP